MRTSARALCVAAALTALSSLAQTATAPFPGQHSPSPATWRYPVWPSACLGLEGGERVACLEWNVFDFGRLERYAAANAALAPPEPGAARCVFFGDSITDGWSGSSAGFFPGKPYVNRGIGGQTTAQMLLRFRADVIELQPRVVVILAGTNDLAGNSGPASFSSTSGNLASMAELARAHRIEVVLASLLPVTDATRDDAGQPRMQTRYRPPEAIDALNRWLAEYARANGHVHLDYFTALAGADGRLRTEFTQDGLHPNAAGYARMAPLAERAIAEALRSGAVAR